jgi:hypothetical protein
MKVAERMPGSLSNARLENALQCEVAVGLNAGLTVPYLGANRDCDEVEVAENIEESRGVAAGTFWETYRVSRTNPSTIHKPSANATRQGGFPIALKFPQSMDHPRRQRVPRQSENQ